MSSVVFWLKILIGRKVFRFSCAHVVSIYTQAVPNYLLTHLFVCVCEGIHFKFNFFFFWFLFSWVWVIVSSCRMSILSKILVVRKKKMWHRSCESSHYNHTNSDCGCHQLHLIWILPVTIYFFSLSIKCLLSCVFGLSKD